MDPIEEEMLNEYEIEVAADVKLSTYNGITVEPFGFTTKATVSIEQFTTNKKIATITISSITSNRYCNFNMSKEVTVSDEVHQKFVDAWTEVQTLRDSLKEILDNLSTISRKERELRGALAEKTLRDAGVGELFDDATLLNLVSLPQLSMKRV